MNDFTLFQKYFKLYQEKFGLLDYQVYFKHELLESSFASITVNHEDMVATVRLNSKCDKANEPFKHIKVSAKHEAIHLLLSRLEDRAATRYTQQWELHETVEGLVSRLQILIPDIKV